MRVGVGLPNAIPGCPGGLLAQWSRAAEALSFDSLATIDRIAYPTHDPLASLAAAAAVTERIALVANIVVGPTRNPVLLAKETATVQALADGRFVLGLGVGDRRDDFDLAGASFDDRGRALDQLISSLRSSWRAEPPPGSSTHVVPVGVSIPLLVAGHGEHGIRRAVRTGSGWTVGGLSAVEVAPLSTRLRELWRAAGRERTPFVVALAYFALGEDVHADAERYLAGYYACYGSGSPEETIVAGLLRDRRDVLRAVADYAEAGVDELVLYPAVAHVGQLERLKAALGSG